MIKILNLRLVILLEYQNFKIVLEKALFQLGLKNYLLKKVKNAVPWAYVQLFMCIYDLRAKEIVETLSEKELRNTIQEEFRVEKLINRTVNKVFVQWKSYDSFFNSWVDKKRHIINKYIFPRTEIFRRKSESSIGLSNFAKNQI